MVEIAVLWAETRMGELLEEIPMKRDKESSNKRTSLLSLPPGITHKQSFYAQKLANAREKYYGSLKEQAEKYSINYKSIQAYQLVAKAYEISTRIDTLSFNHHQIAAAEDDRLEWLEKAETEIPNAKNFRISPFANNEALQNEVNHE